MLIHVQLLQLIKEMARMVAGSPARCASAEDYMETLATNLLETGKRFYQYGRKTLNVDPTSKTEKPGIGIFKSILTNFMFALVFKI